KCEFEDTIDTASTKRALLHDHLVLGAVVHPAADGRILAFVVLANNPEIDIARFAIAQRRLNSGHQAYGAQVHILAELTPNREEKAPQRNGTGTPGNANRPEKDRVMPANPLKPVFRHHSAVLGVKLAAPRKGLPGKLDAIFSACGLEYPHAFGYDFVSDPVPGD